MILINISAGSISIFDSSVPLCITNKIYHSQPHCFNEPFIFLVGYILDFLFFLGP